MLRYKRWTFEAWYQSECTNIPSLASCLAWYHLETTLGNEIIRYPMHASFSFHHSNLQLAYTTQAWNLNLKLVPCKQTHEMHIQMQQSSLWACPPTCVLKILIDPLTFSYLSSYVKVLPLCHLITIFVHYFSPFVINDHKGSILDRLRLSMSINRVRINFPNFVQSRTLAKVI